MTSEDEHRLYSPDPDPPNLVSVWLWIWFLLLLTVAGQVILVYLT